MDISDEIDYGRDECFNEAYLLAASFFLNSWPSEWTSERLAMALLAEEGDMNFEDQSKITLWKAIEKHAEEEGEEKMYFTESLIMDLADAMVAFKRTECKKSE
jgi:hypothetical protein